MAGLGPINVELNITGDLLPIVRAFGMMHAALTAHGHTFTEDERAALAAAVEQLERRSVQSVELDALIDRERSS